MSHYAAGRRFEWRCRRHLEEQGAHVIRSAGSKGLVDLAAWWPAETGQPCWWVQCKRDRASPAERAALTQEARKHGTVPVLMRAGRRGEIVVDPLVGP